MTRTNKWWWTAAGFAGLALGSALTGLSCAPVEEPSPQDFSRPDGEASQLPAPNTVPPPKGLEGRLDAALTNIRDRSVRTDNGFWTVFHYMLGLGPTSPLLDVRTNKRVPAIEYVRNGGPIAGMEFFTTADGLDVRIDHIRLAGKGQGHQDQFVAEMVEWDLPGDTLFKVDGREY